VVGNNKYIYWKFPSLSVVKEFENRLRFDEVTAMSLVAPFWNTVYIEIKMLKAQNWLQMRSC